jgi:hypothetical protein
MKKTLTLNMALFALTPLVYTPAFLTAQAGNNNEFLFSLALHAHSPVPLANEDQPIDYENTFELMKDFLNLHVKAEKSINYWVQQFMGLIRKKGEAKVQALAPFLREFNTALRSRQPALIGLAFQHHKEKFGEPALTDYVKKQLDQPNGLTKLTNILKARLMK